MKSVRYPLAACLMLCLCGVSASFLEARDRRVSVPAEARLEAVLAALQSATGGTIVSERPRVEHRLPKGLNGVLVDEALKVIATEFDLQWIRRGPCIAFQKRYRDPLEEPDLESDELKSVVADLAVLSQTKSPYPIDVSVITDKKDFVQQLSSEQARRMQEEHYPFTALTPGQQKLWLKINVTQAYGDVDLAAQQCNAVLSQWGRVSLGLRTNSQGFVERDLFFPNRRTGRETFHWFEPGSGDAPRGLSRQNGGVDLPPASTRFPSAFRASSKVTSGEHSVAEVLEVLSRDSGLSVTAVPHASQRRLFVFANGAPMADVLGGMGDVYGWRLQPESEKRLTLGRARVNPVAAGQRGFRDGVQSILPPALLWWILDDTALGTRVTRQSHRCRLVFEAIEKTRGKTWSKVSVTDLDQQTQDRIAQQVFDIFLYGELSQVTQADHEPLWKVAPERGYFTLSGPLGPGNHPMLMFQVSRGDGKADAWGWAVGTSSLD